MQHIFIQAKIIIMTSVVKDKLVKHADAKK